MQIAMIWAQASNGVIGKENAMPWHIPEDLKHFKATTSGKPVLMGRKTFESIGRPLPNRQNIVVTHNSAWHHDGVEVFHDPQAALSYANSLVTGDDEVIVMGGGEIYRALLPFANRLYVTKIDAEFEGDAYAPDVDWSQWQLVSEQAQQSQSGLAFRVCQYQRR